MSDDKKTIHIPLYDEFTPSEGICKTEINALATAQAHLEGFSENLIKSFEVCQTVTNAITPFLGNLGSAIIEASQFANAMSPLLGMVEQIYASLTESIIDIRIPTLAEKQKREILTSHQMWGKCGWTWFPSAPLKIYFTPPVDIEDANIKVKPYCSEKQIEELFVDLRMCKIRQDDLESAIFCYKNRQYKACVLLLFALIDAKLIRKQTKDWRSVGLRAVDELKSQLEGNEQVKMFFTMLRFANLVAFLETIFATANNFKNESLVINRNFVAHGMSSRRTRKRDCIQLFLGLRNLLRFTEDS